jgi:isocitrate/isopropylmalate dehydrogenase
MVEPVHGSAPDIEGKGIANPLATIRAAAYLLQNLGGEENTKLAKKIEDSVQEFLSNGNLTPDLGGTATTVQVTDSILNIMNKKK